MVAQCIFANGFSIRTPEIVCVQVFRQHAIRIALDRGCHDESVPESKTSFVLDPERKENFPRRGRNAQQAQLRSVQRERAEAYHDKAGTQARPC